MLQELIAAGWSTPDLAAKARKIISGWYALLVEVVNEASQRLGGLGPFSSGEVAALVACAFLGAESQILLGFERQQLPIRAALRRVGALIRQFEEAPRPGGTPVART